MHKFRNVKEDKWIKIPDELDQNVDYGLAPWYPRVSCTHFLVDAYLFTEVLLPHNSLSVRKLTFFFFQSHTLT